MKNLIKYVQDINFQKKMWQSDEKVVVGVSGGPDSMCLVDILQKISQKANLTIIIAHVNYGLRGDDSLADEQLVKKYAKKYNIICEVLVCGDNIAKGGENLWRNIRYDFFKKIVTKYEANKIAIAHTKNDQAETVLGHLIRGSGLQGLSGMRQKSDNNIIRPLLTILRDDVLKYCNDYNILYNIDKTNKNTVFVRNKLREELIPELIHSYNPNIIDVLANTAMIIADDQNFLEIVQQKFWRVESINNSIIFSASKFLSKHPSQQRLALRTIIQQIRGNLVDIEIGFIEELRKTIASVKNKNQVVNMKNLKMMKNNDTVRFVKLG